MGRQIFLNKIKVIGVGGAGGNTVKRIFDNYTEDLIDFHVLNTDVQVFENLKDKNIKSLQIGSRTTNGLGAGMKPEIGERSAIEDMEEIQKILKGAEIVFISAGLGGGTGTGASPIIAKTAKEMGMVVVSVVTKPFDFEGKKRKILAEEGYKKIKEYSDMILSISNANLLKTLDKKTGIKESFEKSDEILANAITAIINIIVDHGNNDINLDFADIRTILEHKGVSFVGIGEHETKSEEENASLIALKKSFKSELLENKNISTAKGVIINFNIHPDYSLFELNETMSFIEEKISEETTIIFGTITDESIPLNKVKITTIFTGIEEKNKNFSSKTVRFQNKNDIIPYFVTKEKVF